jgi:hypothetical protein
MYAASKASAVRAGLIIAVSPGRGGCPARDNWSSLPDFDHTGIGTSARKSGLSHRLPASLNQLN